MSAKNTHPRRILLVDDDPAELARAAENLVGGGYEVTTAGSGEEALRCAQAATFGLAVLDMRMPGMTGAQLAARLANEFGCFSLILSGHGDPQAVRDAVRDGALGDLKKPLQAAELIPAVETGLARSLELARLLRSHDHLSVALREGRETSIAVGMLMERLHLGRAAAFERLRGLARSQRRRVEEVAEELIAAAETLNAAGLEPVSRAD
jgi:response regulator NasT